MGTRKTPRFFLILDGPSCGGKSSVASEIQTQLPGVFNAKRDRIKWLISDYASKRYTSLLEDMMYKMIGSALEHGLSVLQEGKGESQKRVEDLARKYGMPVFFANISAPKEVLESRFKERIDAKKQGAKIANVDPMRFEKLRRDYEKKKQETILEFDSAVMSPKEIATKIISHIKEHIK